LTRVLVECDNDRATALPTPMLPPRHREVALGAAHVLLVPVHRKLFERISALDLRLPPLARACGAPQEDALVVAAVDEQRRTDRGGIDEVRAGCQVFVDEGLLDGLRALRLMDRGRCRMHLREQMRLRRLTRFADVDHVPGPLRVAFVAVPRLDIIGGFDAPAGRRPVPPPPLPPPLLPGPPPRRLP